MKSIALGGPLAALTARLESAEARAGALQSQVRRAAQRCSSSS